MRPAHLLLLTWGLALAMPAHGDRSRHLAELGRQLSRAEAATRAGAWQRAEPLLRQALDDARTHAPDSLLHVRAQDGLASLLAATQRPAEARPLFEAAVEGWERLLGPDQPRRAVTLHNLGLVLARLGEADLARRRLEQALSIWTEWSGADSPEAANTRRALRQLAQPADQGSRGAGSTDSP